jgi:hypothetical protein
MDVTKTVTFIQYKLPKLKAGEYKIDASLVAGPKSAPVTYGATRGFAVTGPRFKLDGADLASVFPPDLANGEFTGVLPNAVLSRPILPWLRSLYSADDSAKEANTPWLAVLTIGAGELPPQPGTDSPVLAKTVADLVPAGTQIEVAGAAPLNPPVAGALPAGTVSYPNLAPTPPAAATLDYGESPADPVNVIDVPVTLFTRIAPTAADLDVLAHLRETDTYDSVDSTDTILTRAIVLGNRFGAVGAQSTAFLVSLEEMHDLLPDDQGHAGAGLAGATSVRLAVLTSWRFFVNDGGEKLDALLEGLNKDGFSSLRMPAPPVDGAKVDAARTAEASGLSDAQSADLVGNALAAGFVPLGHHLREAGQTVSWYRGPLLPYGPVAAGPFQSATGPDGLLRYDPQVGMFDVSYAAAWQLGQLVGLRSRGYSVALYQWKRQVDKAAALAAEIAELERQLPPQTGDDDDPSLLGAFLRRRAALVSSAPPDLPAPVVDFLGGLRLLKGIPFSYLVPDAGMLPPETLRMFTLDPGWIEALIDGAFSIGRTSEDQRATDQAAMAAVRPLSAASARRRRRNDRPHLAALKADPPDPAMQVVTGFLLRSQAVRGWPKLQVDGYSSDNLANPPDVPKLRMEHLSKDVLLCLFDGVVKMIAIHEPPEQLHSGVEFDTHGAARTTLRAVAAVGPYEPGEEFPNDPGTGAGFATIPLRADNRTIAANDGATSIQTQLNTQFQQGVDPITANEFALEMVKGVVRVVYTVTGS